LKAVILAAGKGTRLQPFTLTRPKSLLPIGGTPLLEWLLREVREAGIVDVLVVTHYMEDMIRAHFGDGSELGVNIGYAKQEQMEGTADAFRQAEKFADGEDFLGVYGDHFLSQGVLRNLVEAHREGEATLATLEMENPSQYGVLKIEGGLVKGIVEKPDPKVEASKMVNAGIYVFPPGVFKFIKDTGLSVRGEYEITDTMQAMVEAGHTLRPFEIGGEDWMDIGLPWSLLEANTRALSGLEHRIEGEVEEGATLHGPVWVKKGARVRSGAYVEGPVIIDEGGDVGPNCLIRGSTYLGRGTRIGNACEVKNSMVMDGTHIAHLSYVGDSVIGEGCNFGAGTITANLRFDKANVNVTVRGRRMDSGTQKLGVLMGDNVQTGINVSFWPGVTVGVNSWIAPGITVQRDVPNDTFITAPPGYKEKPR